MNFTPPLVDFKKLTLTDFESSTKLWVLYLEHSGYYWTTFTAPENSVCESGYKIFLTIDWQFREYVCEVDFLNSPLIGRPTTHKESQQLIQAYHEVNKGIVWFAKWILSLS